MVYCPYTDSEIEVTKTSPEHIIPLSLGGVNGFEIPVCKAFNSSVGSKIDGAVANDFGIKIKRGKVDARGHSNKKPVVEITKAKCSATEKPLKVSFEEGGLKLWSHLDKEYLQGKNTISCQFKVKLDIEEPFVSKVALSAGYYAYGEAFKENVAHDNFRKIMNNTRSEAAAKNLKVDALVDTRFYEVTEDPLKIFRLCCKVVGDSSLVGMVPSQDRFAVFVGVLGEYLGMVSVPASSIDLPNSGEYRMGHVICIQNGKIHRLSFFDFCNKINEFQ